MTLPSMSLRAVRFAIATVLLLAVGILTAPPARAASATELETCFLTQINNARASQGAQPLGVLSSLSAYGRTHSADMANAGDLFHSGAAQVEPHLPTGWQAWGENVGYATGSQNCDWLFEGFWESPNHRANLLNPIFDTVGIGVIVDGSDTIWTTHVFVQTASTPPPTTTTTTAAPTTTPATTAPAPPTTTTATAANTTTTTSTIAPVSTTLPTTTTTDRAPAETSTTTTAAAADAKTSTAVATTAPSSTTTALDPAPSVAGVTSPCTTGCSEGSGYAIFLGLVAVGGLAISWWAFRS